MKKLNIFNSILIISIIVILLSSCISLGNDDNRIRLSKIDRKIVDNITNKFKKHTKVDYAIKIVNKDNYSYIPGYKKSILSLLKDDNRIIEVTHPGSLLKNKKPSEVYAIMDSFLYLKYNHLENGISGISCFYMLGGLDDNNDFSIIISTKEFEKLYSDEYKPDSSYEDLIALLSNKWIKQTNFVKGRSGAPKDNGN